MLLYWSIFTLREGYPHFDTTSGVRVYGYPYTAVYTDAYGSASYTGRGSTFEGEDPCRNADAHQAR